MGDIIKKVSVGFLLSLFATAAGVFLYLEYFSKEGFDESIQMIIDGDLYGKIISLAALPNLFIFFIFIKKKQDYHARGVLLGVILTALFTLVLKFI